ncbi:glycosyltransferase [Pedobacter aquatilis]|uniref:glycosyltransferase n=1 Tax=Pedobacter aquatilis TaxID=351343 RepID=UPI002931DDE6|nr:glycosyltransferase [Pedobacter aquatilis]
MNDITVILPVHNGQQYLEESILSVLSQSSQAFDFIICDDFSSDSSKNIIQGIQEKYPDRIKFIKNTRNLGLFATLNILINTSLTNLIHIWAQDDIMKSDCLVNCIQFHKKHPNLGMSYHSVEYIDENNNIIENHLIDNTPEIIPLNLYLNISVRYGCITDNISTVTLNKAIIEKTDLFRTDLKVSGDFEFWTRIAEMSSIGRIDRKLIYLRRHSNQLSRNFKSIYPRIVEDISIHKKIISLMTGNEKNKGRKFYLFKTQTSYFNDFLFLISKKEYQEAKKTYKSLSAETNIIFLLFRWLIFTVSRKLKIEKLLLKVTIA